uniref:hypothetical protein n=1 Tax=Pararhizobium sp. IMCC3301 TaxID=3067904 RepID=UPI0027425C6D|nr:hypothetical protein [Pararhizobium sp. IMCC3301]
MTEDVEEGSEAKKNDVLTFKVPGRILDLSGLEAEFRAISAACGKVLTAEIAARVCTKSGTHLIKLVSPRTDGDHAVLRVDAEGENAKQQLLPSVNAPDIPFAKILFRPLEVTGYPTKSVIQHVMYSDDISEIVLRAFTSVFGADVLKSIRSVILGPPPEILKLSHGEFPIIFIPSPDGGDLQITPVSPAAAFMDIKEVSGLYFQKQVKDAPRVPRGRWHKQAVSSKPQNISGAIGGQRFRFLAEMPRGLAQYDAELYRYVNGGSFPRWRDPDVAVWVMRYADLIDRDKEYNNQDTRAGLDRLADRLINDALAFTEEIVREAASMANAHDIAVESLEKSPRPATVLLRRSWQKDGFDRARLVLGGAHFDYREKQIRKDV